MGLDCPTEPSAPIGNIGDYSALSNPDLTKENPGALAGATEVKDAYETGEFPEHDSPVWAGAPAIILRHFCGVAV